MTITSDNTSITTSTTEPVDTGSAALHTARRPVDLRRDSRHRRHFDRRRGRGAGHRDAPADGGPAVVEADLQPVTLAAVSAAAVAAGGTDPLASLPTTVATFLGAIAISHVRVAVDLANRSIVEASVTIATDQALPLIPGRVEIASPAVTLTYTRAGDSHTVAVIGAGSVLGSAVQLSVQRSDDGSFSISMTGPDGAAIPVPDVDQLATLVGAADASSVLPAQLNALAGLSIGALELTMNHGGVQSMHVAVATTESIDLPDPFALSIRQLTLDIAVEHAGDAATRTVAVSVGAEARFAGADIVVTFERTDGQWHCTGSLRPGSTLSASAIARTYGAGLPAQLPELALTEFTLTAAFGTGEVSVTAGSSTEWTVPIGPSGIGVAALAVRFSRHAPTPTAAPSPVRSPVRCASAAWWSRCPSMPPARCG